MRRCFSSLRTDAASAVDLCVVGGGIMGAWTAIMASKRGASVVLADQFSAAHENGSSHGDGRIYRLAYIEDLYVDMMQRSLPLWHELQEFAGHDLLAQTGGLQFAPKSTGRLVDQISTYQRRGIAHEVLSASESNARFPQLHLAEDEDEAIFQEDFGVLFASKCIGAAWKYASSLGVQTVTPFRATTLKQTADGTGSGSGMGGSRGLVIEGADGAPIFARSAVIAPGAWLTSMADSLLGLSIPTHVSAETVCYYAPKKDCPDAAKVDHSYRSMPCFIPEFDNGLGPFGYCTRQRA